MRIEETGHILQGPTIVMHSQLAPPTQENQAADNWFTRMVQQEYFYCIPNSAVRVHNVIVGAQGVKGILILPISPETKVALTDAMASGVEFVPLPNT